jgi:hypothetical protein
MAKIETNNAAETHEDWPQPWTKPEDREGWEVVARGSKRRDRPPVGTALLVELSREQARWVRDTASQAGISQVELVRSLNRVGTARLRKVILK